MKKHLTIIIILLIALLFRVYLLDKYPSGFNADEASLGYNAYSLLQTGRDEHGARWPLVFRSFNDYKPPLYFYLVLPFVKFMGLTIYAVRLPSAILGVVSVYLIYLLSNQLFSIKSSLPKRERSLSFNIGHLSALILATSPWHIHFSRGAWESNVGTFFVLLSVWSFIKALSKPKFIYLSFFSAILSLYSYHSMRLVTPLLFLGLFYIYRKKIGLVPTNKKYLKHIFVAIILAFLITFPLMKQMFGTEGRSRFSGVSIFADKGPLWEALERRRQSPHPNSIQTRIIHNKYLSYSRRFLSNYLSHYSPVFLFLNGDNIARNKTPGMGQFYLFLFPFYYLGLYYLIKKNTNGTKTILFWFLVSPLAASLTFQSPHALRSENMSIPLSIIVALGMYEIYRLQKKHFKRIVGISYVILLGSLFIYSPLYYFHQYSVHYPRELPFAWEYGFDQVANYIKQNQDNYDKIIISDRYDQPYIIMAFYLKYPPKKLQSEIKLTPRDKFGFSTVKNMGKFEFKKINWGLDAKSKKTLIIATEELVPSEITPIHTVLSPSGKDMFKFYDTQL